jgi:hypothetical protein
MLSAEEVIAIYTASKKNDPPLTQSHQGHETVDHSELWPIIKFLLVLVPEQVHQPLKPLYDWRLIGWELTEVEREALEGGERKWKDAPGYPNMMGCWVVYGLPGWDFFGMSFILLSHLSSCTGTPMIELRCTVLEQKKNKVQL